jgi:diguanylate cyclase (GGDEF)-like protein/PAS domain S-box-containing protein
MNERLNILVVDDSNADFRLMERQFLKAGFAADCVRVESQDALLELLKDDRWDIALLDYNMPQMRFHDALAAVNKSQPDLPVILVSGSVVEEQGLELLQRGLWDFVSKEQILRLPVAIERNLKEAQARKLLREADQEARISALAFESSDAIIIADASGVIQRVNRAFCETTDYRADEVVGQHLSILGSSKHDEAFYDVLWRNLNTVGSWQGEIWRTHKSGEAYLVWQTITGVKDDSGNITHLVSVARDITARKAAEEQIARLAFFDPLTKLPNRRLLIDRLHLALTASRRSRQCGALMFIDLDNFKNINDTLGHDKGDMLLVEVAERLSNCVRVNDTVARLGGDEFVILLENLPGNTDSVATQARLIAEKARHEISKDISIGGLTICVTPSIGIALFGKEGEASEDLLKWADLAMYQAKSSGRNAVHFFDPAMQTNADARIEMESDLRRAIARKEFFLQFQPKVNRDGVVTGTEALIRWRHPKRGLVSPTVFVPVAEECGLILPIGDHVITGACEQLSIWQHQRGMETVTIAVNVSVRQFRNPFICEEIEARLQHFGADPRGLMIELTESLLAEHRDDIAGRMARLKKSGVRFSLDDFGTGYSSLSYLKQLPFDQVKIDRSFVNDALTDTGSASLIRAIIAMSHSLGLKVVAEGVETPEQWAFLCNEGCDEGQGYLFCRPAAVEDLKFGKIY